jgi:hypothetical protein
VYAYFTAREHCVFTLRATELFLIFPAISKSRRRLEVIGLFSEFTTEE